jgi:hypothetical protein
MARPARDRTHQDADHEISAGIRMCESVDDIRTLDALRAFIHRKLCEKENLLDEQFSMSEMKLSRGKRACGLQFLLRGPRSVRLGAIWASDQNTIYLYDARGERYEKVRLAHRLIPGEPQLA